MSGPNAVAAPGFNERRLRANCLRNLPAMEALGALGLDRSAVMGFGFGMKEPYRRSDGVTVDGVLTYPIERSEGRCRYGYVNLEPITVAPEHRLAWSPGDAREVRCGEGDVLIVVGSPIALFQARTVIERRSLHYVVVTSSQPDFAPAVWDQPDHWAGYDRVIVCEDVPGLLVARIRASARRPLERGTRIQVSTTSAASAEAQLDESMEELVTDAVPLTDGPIRMFEEGLDRSGDFAAEPISLHGGFSRGHLYYPFLVERRQRAAAGSALLLHSYETLVLRSDGSILEAKALPSPPGATSDQRVYALTDGTRIGGLPAPSRNATWRLEAIQEFAAARSAGCNPCRRPAGEVLAQVRAMLAARVWLPDPDDHWAAAVFVVMSHMFRVFRALPILLVSGPHGTGKSELGAAMVELGFNAVMMGQGSAAALIRLSRECGGLVVLDDAEGLGTAGSGFGELSQCLKTGYRAETARKPITQGSGRVETYDFFGPRVITCTSGVDPVLGSRCIIVRSAVRDAPAPTPDLEIDARSLRDELHALAMSHARDVHADYESRMADATGREEEIWAPLLSIAEVLGCADAMAALGRKRAGGE